MGSSPLAASLWAGLNDSTSIVSGVTSAVAVAGLTLIDPNRVPRAGRLAYRGLVGSVTGLGCWTALADPELPKGVQPGVTAVATVLGATLPMLGSGVDARIQRGLTTAGVKRPRVAMAAAAGAISLGAWWQSRRLERAKESMR